MSSPRRRAAVITVSDRAAAGTSPDRSGPRAVELLAAGGYDTGAARIVPDGVEPVSEAIRAALQEGARLVVTTGGTGVSPRDRTPEGTLPLLTMHLPGVAEALRRSGGDRVPTSILSRGVAGITGQPPALVVNLAGSPGAVEDGVPVVLSVAGHVLDQLDGVDH